MADCSDSQINQIQAAIAAAVTFLCRSRNNDGWWTDFHLAAGISDEWVTGYVGHALASVPNALAQKAAQEAWSLLNTRREQSGGWGYNQITPGDADSTGWGLQLADTLGLINSDRGLAAQRFLARHVKRDQASAAGPAFITTYAVEGPIRQFIGYPWYMPMRGWCHSPHLCVTAAVAHLSVFREQLLPYLRHSQNPDGSWNGYWWRDPEYTTALAATALAQSAQLDDQMQIAKTILWAQQRINDGINGTSAFALAWQASVLQCANPSDRSAWEAFDMALTRLLAMQQPDGAWPASAWLRVPLPDDCAPDDYQAWLLEGRKEGSIALDQQANFTTGTVLRMLQKTVTINSSY